MTRTFDHQAPGTPERAWLRGNRPDLRPATRLQADHRLLVVSAHPDDETVGAGGLIATAARIGVPVMVLVASDGEASHPRSVTHTAQQLADIRRAEVRAAIGRLHPHAEVRLLGLPDGQLSDNLPTLSTVIADLAAGCSHVITPWRGDRHPDHEACAKAATEAIAGLGQPPELWQYPIWAWHWADPDSPDIPWAHMQCVVLSNADRLAKLAAIRMHVSQHLPLSDKAGDEAILSPATLAYFTRDYETFVVEPAAAPAASTTYFDALYQRTDDPWGLQRRFYEQRKRDLLLASLPRARFRRAFEPGCALGLLTEALAQRSDQVIAWDAAAAAVDLARRRTSGAASCVQLARGRIPAQWPDGRFDLIVLSEVGYYCLDLDHLSRRIVSSLTADGTLVACHWRWPADDHPQSSADVHRVVGRDLRMIVEHVEADFLLHVWTRAGRSVAQQDGIVP